MLTYELYEMIKYELETVLSLVRHTSSTHDSILYDDDVLMITQQIHKDKPL